jgi:hypothetical protein
MAKITLFRYLCSSLLPVWLRKQRIKTLAPNVHSSNEISYLAEIIRLGLGGVIAQRSGGEKTNYAGADFGPGADRFELFSRSFDRRAV